MHDAAVRRLARSMLADEHLADDVAQETWLRSLLHPPDAAEAAVSWLAVVTRNLATVFLRAGARRAAREAGVARPEAVPSAADDVAADLARRAMLDAVLGLDEPYRTVILLRYYRDLPVRHVAATLGIPPETVRTRVKRALALLRGRLIAERPPSTERPRAAASRAAARG